MSAEKYKARTCAPDVTTAAILNHNRNTLPSMRMLKALWLLTRTIALSVIVDVGVAAAQTVIVRNAPANAPIEVQMDGGSTRSATADASGDATVQMPLPSGSTEAAVQVFVDRCDPTIRVQLVRRGVPVPPAAAGCQRGDGSGAFLMQAVTTFVVDVEEGGGSVHVRQGPPPRSWLARDGEAAGERRTFQSAPPTGLMLSAGAGLSKDSQAIDTICGTATTCTGDRFSSAVGLGATYWFPRIFGIQASLARRAEAKAQGSGDTYQFDGGVETSILSLSGLAGGSVGAVRLYAQGGINRHRARFTSTQTTQDRTVTVNGVVQTLPGGTQTSQYTTEGWSWLMGGGVEAWVNRVIALYGDAQYAKLRGADTRGGEARTDDSLFVVIAGIRVHLGR
jgi:hypothetical protein